MLVLKGYEFDIKEKHDVYLGEFCVMNRAGELINTDLIQFDENRLTISLLKGHYMRN